MEIASKNESDEVISRLRSCEATLRKCLLKTDQQNVQLRSELAVVRNKYKQSLLTAKQFRITEESSRNNGGDVDSMTIAAETVQPAVTTPDHLLRMKNVAERLQTAITSAKEVAEKLHDCAVLSVEEFQAISSGDNDTLVASQKLVEIMLQKQCVEEYRCFLHALKSIEQTSAYILLTLGDINVNDEHVRIIREHYFFLLDNLDTKFSCLLDQLYSRHVIDIHEKELLEADESSVRRTQLLLSLLSHKTPNLYLSFLSALRHNGQRHVVDVLEGKAQTENDRRQQNLNDDPDNDDERQKANSVASDLQAKLASTTKLVDNLKKTLQVKDDQLFVLTRRFSEQVDLTLPLNRELLTQHSALNKVGSSQDRIPCFDTVTLTLLYGLPEDKPVNGMTVLGKELYVHYIDSGDIAVYDAITFQLLRRLSIPGLTSVVDIASSKLFKCVYLADDHNNVIHKVEITSDGMKLKHWLCHDKPAGLSVNSRCNTITVACSEAGKIKVFAAQGELVKEVVLQNEIKPSHALRLTGDKYLVCYGEAGDLTHGVCVVDGNGQIQQSFGGAPASGDHQLNAPVRLALINGGFILVADTRNHRVLMLSPDLVNAREILAFWDVQPWRIHFDVDGDRIYVAGNKLNADNKDWISGQTKVYGIVG